MIKSYDVIAYQYQADTLCPTCTVETLIAQGKAAPGARGMDAHTAIAQIVDSNGFVNEWEYDSHDLPKAYLDCHADSLAVVCGSCHDTLLTGAGDCPACGEAVASTFHECETWESVEHPLGPVV